MLCKYRMASWKISRLPINFNLCTHCRFFLLQNSISFMRNWCISCSFFIFVKLFWLQFIFLTSGLRKGSMYTKCISVLVKKICRIILILYWSWYLRYKISWVLYNEIPLIICFHICFQVLQTFQMLHNSKHDKHWIYVSNSDLL